MADARTGRCHCKAITFEFHGEPNWIAHCHCESCRRNTSSPVTTFLGVPYSAFRFKSGTPTVYQSSPGVQRSFCGACGSPVAFESTQFPDEIHLYLAALDDPEALAPARHVHTGEQLSWFEIDDDLPRFEFGSAGSKPGRSSARRS